MQNHTMIYMNQIRNMFHIIRAANIESGMEIRRMFLHMTKKQMH